MAAVRIFLPTYRRPQMLPRALASLLAQTHQDWICELHNDAPDDPAPGELLARLNDPRITLVTHPRNLGGTATFNLFFRGCAEPFYSILEDDNWWEPNFLSSILAVANDHPAVTLFWANMRIAQEESNGETVFTGQTIWPTENEERVRLFSWGDQRQIAGALHSNGAALFRSRPGQNFEIPQVPFAVIEPFRERLFPYPIALLSQPLATFTITKETARSRDQTAWAESQAMLAATFFENCPWTTARMKQVWDSARTQHPPGTSNLIMAILAKPSTRLTLRHTSWRDWWIVLRGFVRRPWLYFHIFRSRRRHPDWWQFLEKHARRQWLERPASN